MTVNAFPRLKLNLCCLRAHQLHHLFIYNLNDHLPRIQSVHHILSDCAFLHIFYKLLYDFEVNIRF